MKLGLVIGRFPPQATGGAEVQAMLMAGLLSRGHRVTVFTRRLDSAPRAEERDGYTVVRTPTAAVPGARLLSDLVVSTRAIGMRRDDIEALLCFQTINSGVIGALCRRAFGIPFVVWIRGQEEYGWSTGVEKRILVPLVLRSAGRILVQSERIRDELRTAVGEVRGAAFRESVTSKIRVVPTMVEPGVGSPRHDGAVLFVGRLVRVKGVELLIEAMRLLEGRSLVIVGDGPEREALERASEGLDVKFEGMLPHEEVRRRFQDAAVLVQPSLAEGMPNTVLEAMAHGVPVVATAVAGVPEIVTDGKTGFLLEDRDPALLASRLRSILSDRETWERMSEACRVKAREYSPEAVLPRLEGVLRDVIGRA
jgi:glycosyltransferase involved in cell wall biosynthesis